MSDEQRLKRLCVALAQSPYVCKQAFAHGIIYRLPMTAERPDAIYKVRILHTSHFMFLSSLCMYTSS